jgi:hypothetical protein
MRRLTVRAEGVDLNGHWHRFDCPERVAGPDATSRARAAVKHRPSSNSSMIGSARRPAVSVAGSSRIRRRCWTGRLVTTAATWRSLQHALDELRDLFGDPLVHRLRQFEPVVEDVHAGEQAQQLVLNLLEVVEAPADQAVGDLFDMTATEQPQHERQRVADLLGEMQPIGPGVGQGGEIC